MATPPPHNSLPIRSKISAGMLLTAFQEAWRRFPVTVVYVLYTAVWCVVYTLSGENLFNTPYSGKTVAALWYLGSVGIPLTLAVTLWSEYLSRRSLPYMIVANILLFADVLYIICGTTLSDAWWVGRSAIVTALVVAIIFVPSRKSWAWNFANKQVESLLISGVFAVALSIAVGIIFGTVFALFDVDSYKAMFCVQETVAIIVPSIIFLHLVPRREQVEILSETYKATKFQCGTAKFFFLALTVIYMAILYVYGLKILFTWELPHGVVSWSVTGLTVAVLVTLFLLEGVRRSHPDDSLTLKATRLLPVAMIPLFVLMSVGVLYRIGQYGLTASRLYVLTFNVWCYVVFAYMIFSRTRRFNGVAMSFAVVFMLTSIFPYANYISLSNHMMRSKLRQALVEIGFGEFPVGEDEFKETFMKLSTTERKDIESKMHYLDEPNDHSMLEDITEATYYGKGNTYISDYFIYADTLVDTVVIEAGDTIHRIDLEAVSDFVDIPQDYRAVKYHRCHYGHYTFDKDNSEVIANNVNYTFPIDSIMQINDKNIFRPVTLYPRSGNTDTVYVVREINLRYTNNDWTAHRTVGSIDLDGFIFTKKD